MGIRSSYWSNPADLHVTRAKRPVFSARWNSCPCQHLLNSFPGSQFILGLATANSIEFPGAYGHSQQPEVDKELVLVINQVLEVAKQKGQDPFAFRYEGGRQQLTKIRIIEKSKALLNMGHVLTCACPG